MPGRGPGIAVPPGAAGGSQIKRSNHQGYPDRVQGSPSLRGPIRDIEHPAPLAGPIPILVISQRSLQIELIFRLLLKITVERPHECDFDLICVRREPVKQNANQP